MTPGQDEAPQREAPTLTELLKLAEALPPDDAAKLLAWARPAPLVPTPETELAAGPLVYRSWEDFLDRTTATERMA